MAPAPVWRTGAPSGSSTRSSAGSPSSTVAWASRTGRCTGGAGTSERPSGSSRTGPKFLRSAPVDGLARRLAAPLGSPLLDRRAELLRRARLDADVEQAPEIVRLRGRLQSEIVRFRPTWHGKRVGRAVVYDALRRSSDRAERERAWRAEEPLHARLEAPLRKLIGLRNDRARSAGYRTFAELRLCFEGVSAVRLRALTRSAAAPLRGLARDLRSEHADRTGESGWGPWDLRFALEGRAPLPQGPFPGSRMVATIRRGLGAWGFFPRQLRFPVARTDQPFGGLTVAPRIPTNVRILVHPKGGWRTTPSCSTSTATRSTSVRSTSPPTSSATRTSGTRGSPRGSRACSSRSRTTPSGSARSPALDRGAAVAFARRNAGTAVFDAASHGLRTEAELRLYAAPDRDPLPEGHLLARRWFGYDEFASRSWADTFLVTHPVYQQSYLISPLFRAQVAAAMGHATGAPFWPNPAAARWLTESFFASGARYDWTTRLADVTGAPLSASAFVAAATRPD